jgi:hypothetical protein
MNAPTNPSHFHFVDTLFVSGTFNLVEISTKRDLMREKLNSNIHHAYNYNVLALEKKKAGTLKFVQV